MPISQNILENYDTYSRKYMRVIKNIFDCDNCTNECSDNTIGINYREHVVDNLSECPCFKDDQPKICNTDDDNESDITPIYEKLSPGDAYILSKDEDGGFMVAENHDGKVEFRHIDPLE